MPKEMMELFEKLLGMTPKMEHGSFCVDWGMGSKHMDVFLTFEDLLPEGEPRYEYVENIDMWKKIITVNGVNYHTLLSQEEYKAEVA